MGLREFFLGPREVTEAATKLDAPANVTRAGYEYGVPVGGLNDVNTGMGAATSTDRRTVLSQLFDAYLTCPWAWAGVNAIARTITAGPLVFDWDSDDGEGNQEQPDKPAEVLQCERLFKFVNQREDMRQLLRGAIADLLVFGDAYIEVVWVGKQPVALFSLDAPSMFPLADQHGQISGYVQSTELGQKATFEPRDVIHISLDSPRSGIFGTPPVQAALLPITSWLFTAATLKQIYRKGNPPSIHVDLPVSYSPTETTRWRNMFATQNLGPSNIGVPITTKGGGTVNELQARRIDELLHAKDQARDEILATLGVPPAEAGVIESGNIGGGTGESQRKTFLINTCQPIAALLLEKLQYHLVQQGFGVVGWHLKFADVDMRDSEVIEKIRDVRLRNGAWTLDRYRTEIGEPPTEGGNQAVLVDRQNLVLWRDLESYSSAGIAAKLKGTALEPDEPSPGAPVTLSKPEPAPVPAALAPFAGQDNPPEEPPADEEPAPPASPPAGKPSGSRPGRPPRESWSTYSRRVREAMASLPGQDVA